MPTIDKGSKVLVTGATGFIASHVADQLLAAGYHVRGTIRSAEKARWLIEMFDKKYGEGHFETVDVPDLVADDAFDEAVKGVSGIIHLATINTFSNVYDEVVPPTVKGALNILTAATKESSVKSVVYTSSSTAALMPEPDKVIPVTKDTWNDATVAAAQGTSPDGFTVYGASKTEAERAVWKAYQETNPPFQLSTVLPNANFGPILKPGGEDSASTASWVVQLFKGDKSPLNFPPQWFVDVVDDAKMHVAALIDPHAAGKRLFAFAQPYNWNEVLAIFRELYPDKQFMGDIEGMGKDLSEIPNQEAEELLRKHYGKGWTTLEESIKENLKTIA